MNKVEPDVCHDRQ